ncbi:unnamed protein product [Ixodes hexagonus]
MTNSCFLLRRWRKKSLEYFKELGIPGPEPSIIWGNLLEYHRNDRHDALNRWCDKYGDIFGFYNGDVPTLVVKDLNFLQYVFVSNFKNFVDRGITMRTDQVHSSLGKSLIHAKESQWRLLRSCTTLEFTSCKLKQLDCSRQCAHFVNSLQVFENHSKSIRFVFVFDSVPPLLAGIRFGLKNYCPHAAKIHTRTKIPSFYEGSLKHLPTPLISFSECTTTLGILMKPLFWLNRMLGTFTMEMFVQEMKKIVRLRIQNSKTPRNDMLQNLLRAKVDPKHLFDGIPLKNLKSSEGKTPQDLRHLSEEEVVLLTTVLFIGGFQTTSVTLCFMSLLLAMHPEIQEKVRQEVKDTIESSECLDYDTMTHKLKYTSQVMNETLRLFPPSLTFHTRTAKDSFEYNGTTYKAGLCIMAPVLQIHRDPQYWPEPNKFDPERFSPENKGSYPKSAFQPFGVGPRCCVGYKLALMQILYITARIVQNFKMELGKAQKGSIQMRSSGMMAAPSDGPWIKFTRL